MGLAAPFLQVFSKGLGQAPAPVFGFCSSPLGDAGPARIFPPAHKPRLPQMREGGMVRGAPSGVKGACPAPAGCGMVGARKPWCRRSSGVEHALGKGGVVSSILTGGTTNSLRFQRLGEPSLGLPNGRFGAPQCTLTRARMGRVAQPESPNRDQWPRFRSMLDRATAFGGWEESSGKSSLDRSLTVWLSSQREPERSGKCRMMNAGYDHKGG